MLSTVAKLFTEYSNIELLDGGQNESFKVGNIAIKPVYEEEKYLWISEVLNELKSEKISISKPIKSFLGNWIEQGFGATKYINGKFYINRIDEKLEVCRNINQLLSPL